jgi:protoporphyrinogen oxidase
VTGSGRATVVVGGGIVGLTVAQRLAAAGRSVTVLEAGSDLGGLASGWTVPTAAGPVAWDRYYHVILESDAALRGLLRELDLDASVHWTATRTGAFVAGRLAPVSSPADYARLPGLSPLAKARIAATIGRGATTRDWRSLETMTARAWLTRWSGRAAFERFWVPLLAAKLGTAWPEANAAFIWATIQRLTGARRAGVREERFGAVPGGYGRIVTALADRLRDAGVTLRTGTAVARVDGGAPATVVTAAGETLTAEEVVLTTTPRVAAALCPGLPEATRRAYEAIGYQGVVCVSLVLDRVLSPYYLTYLFDELPFTAIVEMTTLVPQEWVRGHTLVYLPRYVAPDDPLHDEPDDVVVERFLTGLRRVHDVPADAVLGARVARTREVFPRPTLGYSTRAPGVATGLRGVALVDSAQIVNGTLNVNESVECATRGVAAILGPAATASVVE